MWVGEKTDMTWTNITNCSWTIDNIDTLPDTFPSTFSTGALRQAAIKSWEDLFAFLYKNDDAVDDTAHKNFINELKKYPSHIRINNWKNTTSTKDDSILLANTLPDQGSGDLILQECQTYLAHVIKSKIKDTNTGQLTKILPTLNEAQLKIIVPAMGSKISDFTTDQVKTILLNSLNEWQLAIIVPAMKTKIRQFTTAQLKEILLKNLNEAQLAIIVPEMTIAQQDSIFKDRELLTTAALKNHRKAIVKRRREVLYKKGATNQNFNWIYLDKSLYVPENGVSTNILGEKPSNVYDELSRRFQSIYLGFTTAGAYITNVQILNAMRMFLDMLARAHLRDDYKNDEEKKNHIGELEWWIQLIVYLEFTDPKLRTSFHLHDGHNNTNIYTYSGHQDGAKTYQTLKDVIKLLGTDIRYLSTETDAGAYDNTIHVIIQYLQYIYKTEKFTYNDHFLWNPVPTITKMEQ